MPKIEYSPLALKDLQAISEYIEDNWGKENSNNILKKIFFDIKKLEQFPKLGVKLEKTINIQTEYRYLISGKNYIFYYLECRAIRIVRILNQQQDYISKLFPDAK